MENIFCFCPLVASLTEVDAWRGLPRVPVPRNSLPRGFASHRGLRSAAVCGAHDRRSKCARVGLALRIPSKK